MRLDADQWTRGLSSLEELCRTEYHQSLLEVIGSPEDVSDRKLGRLVGVLLKEPFAQPTELFSPSQYSGAFRSWELVDERTFTSEQVRGSWQYALIQELQREVGEEERSTYQFLRDAHYEFGLFTQFAKVLKKYICGDPAVRKKVKEALESAGKAGQVASNLTPEYIVGAAGLGLGATLVQHVPILGMVGVPVISALVVILYKLGIEAFCGAAAGGLNALEETR